MSEPVRIAVVGAGAVVQVAHLPVLKKMKGVRVAAIVDTDIPKARALADRYDVPDVYDDLEDCLAHDSFDALLVATPNHLHEPHIQAGLAANCHLLIEKPLALSSAEANELGRMSAASAR